MAQPPAWGAAQGSPGPGQRQPPSHSGASDDTAFGDMFAPSARPGASGGLDDDDGFSDFASAPTPAANPAPPAGDSMPHGVSRDKPLDMGLFQEESQPAPAPPQVNLETRVWRCFGGFGPIEPREAEVVGWVVGLTGPASAPLRWLRLRSRRGRQQRAPLRREHR